MSDYEITFTYKITLDNGVWYVVESNINNPEDFIRQVFNEGDIQIYSLKDKSLFSDTNAVAIPVKKICSIEWKGVHK